jgi:hypothetical protein
MITIPFMVLNNAVDPICKPLVTTSPSKHCCVLAASNAFQKLWGKAPGGDCHAVAAAQL